MSLSSAAFALGTFSTGSRQSFAGLVVGEKIAPLHALGPLFDQLGGAQLGSLSILELLENWERNFVDLQRTAQLLRDEGAKGERWRDVFLSNEKLRFHPPVELPRQVFCAGANYRKHVIDLIVDQPPIAEESLSREEKHARAARLMDERAAHGAPFVFSKPASAITGPYDPVILPRIATQPDWELELAVVMGRPARHVRREESLTYVAGYTIVNDVTNRDLVFRKDAGAMGADWLAAKGCPSYMPMGPYLVPAAFVPDPQNLRITLKLNGQAMQDESSADMIFGVDRIIEYLSSRVQLWPGDLIATGSPAGNGTHYNRFLKPGDIMEGSIEGLGELRNQCVAEEAEAHAAG